MLITNAQRCLQYRTRREELERLGGDVELEAEQAQRLMRYVVQASTAGAAGAAGTAGSFIRMFDVGGPGGSVSCLPLASVARCMLLMPPVPAPARLLQATLGRARSSMVQWLLECLNPASSASMTRSKAIKALGEVVQVRPCPNNPANWADFAGFVPASRPPPLFRQ